MAEIKVTRLRHYIKFHGLTYEEMLFELKRVVYENSLDLMALEDTGEDSMEDETGDNDIPSEQSRTKPRETEADAIERLRSQVES